METQISTNGLCPITCEPVYEFGFAKIVIDAIEKHFGDISCSAAQVAITKLRSITNGMFEALRDFGVDVLKAHLNRKNVLVEVCLIQLPELNHFQRNPQAPQKWGRFPIKGANGYVHLTYFGGKKWKDECTTVSGLLVVRAEEGGLEKITFFNLPCITRKEVFAEVVNGDTKIELREKVKSDLIIKLEAAIKKMESK